MPGLTLETGFGLPVCPAGDHRHTSGLITPPPLALAHKPLLPGGSWLSACQRRPTWLLGCCWCQELRARQARQGTEDVSASGSTWGREQSAAGRQSLGEVPPVVCWLCQWPARTPPPTMAPLFLVARQFGGGSSVTHAPLNRGPINPLGDEDQVKAPRKLPGLFFFLPVGGARLEKSLLTHVHTATGHLLKSRVSFQGKVAPRPSPTPTLVQVPGGRKCQ